MHWGLLRRSAPRFRPRRHSLVVLVLSAVCSGCYNDFEDFVERAARLECKRLENCDAANYSQYEEPCAGLSCNRDTRRRCRDDIEARWRGLDRNDRCEYDPDEARLCIKALRQEKRECPGSGDIDPPSDCDFVFDCN